MKNATKIWLLLTLVAPQLATSATAPITTEETCAHEVVDHKVPKAKLGLVVVLDREHFAPTYKKYLHEESRQRRFANQIERAALLLAYSDKPSHRAFQSNDHTIVKYDLETRELIVVAYRQIIFYERIEDGDGDWFNGLRKAKLRANVRLENAQPFDPLGLVTHFANHGVQFNAADEFEYERRAIEFAESNTKHSLTLECEDRLGRPRWVKIDFATREIVVVAQDSRQVISYYVREHHPFHYFLGRVKISKTAISR